MNRRLNQFFSACILLFIVSCAAENSEQSNLDPTELTERKMTYLALGDSYTISEGVEESLRYPNQLIPLLDNPDSWETPKIIAKTGWTVDELEAGINAEPTLEASYDLVTLLIGVNNQYRGRSVEDFAIEFEKMLLRAIGFAGDRPNHVVVLSIPDWGITPFAQNQGTDQEKVAQEIDAYNAVKSEISEKYGVYYIDITQDYRNAGTGPEMVAEDGLHPSGLIYTDWAKKLAKQVNEITF